MSVSGPANTQYLTQVVGSLVHQIVNELCLHGIPPSTSLKLRLLAQGHQVLIPLHS